MSEEKDVLQEETAGQGPEFAETEGQEGAAAEADQLTREIAILRQEADENRDRLLRLAAEFENYKKRMERERESLLKYAGENILRELLVTVDNLERALEQGTAESADSSKQLVSLLEGVELTRKNLLSGLEKFGVSPVESVGRPFDPNEQEALTMEASSDVPANHVLREFVKGYRFKDRLLRAAKVVVSAGPQ
ncbi:MAG: nucleotide exchange factor GrpE [Desulfobulbus sp.]|nr:MAG: nucleotide exchange factor GrpE [Desulfobulbus sp.]